MADQTRMFHNMGDCETDVGEEAHKEIHASYYETNKQRTRGGPISAKIASRLEQMEDEKRRILLNSGPARETGVVPGLAVSALNQDGVVARGQPRFNSKTFPLPDESLRADFEGLLAGVVGSQSLVLVSLTWHSGGTSQSLKRVECTAKRSDHVVLTWEEDGKPYQSYFLPHRLLKINGAQFASGQHLKRDDSPEAIMNAYERCRDLPLVRGAYALVPWKQVHRPIRLAPDYSTDPLPRERTTPPKIPQVTRWYIFNDPWAPPRDRLGPAPPRVTRVLKGFVKQRRKEQEEAMENHAQAEAEAGEGVQEQGEAQPGPEDAMELQELVQPPVEPVEFEGFEAPGLDEVQDEDLPEEEPFTSGEEILQRMGYMNSGEVDSEMEEMVAGLRSPASSSSSTNRSSLGGGCWPTSNRRRMRIHVSSGEPQGSRVASGTSRRTWKKMSKTKRRKRRRSGTL